MNSTQWLHALCLICMTCYCYVEEYHLEVENLMIIAKLTQRRRLREFNYAYRVREYSAPTWYLIVRFCLPSGLAFLMTSAVYFGYTALSYVNWLDFMVDVCYIPTTLCKYPVFFAAHIVTVSIGVCAFVIFATLCCHFQHLLFIVIINFSIFNVLCSLFLFFRPSPFQIPSTSLIALDSWFVYVYK